MDLQRSLKRHQEMKSIKQEQSKKNISMKKDIDSKLTSFRDHLDKQYGKKGTAKRDRYQLEFESFKLGVMIKELRERKNLTQEQLAERCGTSKSYISRIENNASDIRVSTLMRIIHEGLGAQLKFSVA